MINQICSCGQILYRKFENRRRCIGCGTNHIIKIRTRELLHRNKIIDYHCRHCNKYFSNSRFKHKKISQRLISEIRGLSNIKKGYINKYDNLKKPTYSTREIAKMLNVGKTFVWEVLRKNA